jgi:endonuclease IV
MVQAFININEKTNRILNILKAKYGLKDKSQAIERMAEEYEEQLLEPELKPEYVEKIRKIETQGKFTKYTTLKQLRDEIEHA